MEMETGALHIVGVHQLGQCMGACVQGLYNRILFLLAGRRDYIRKGFSGNLR